MSHHPDWSKRWRVWQDQGDWFVISPEYAERAFRTWREAQDYADRMARTREVVLPRLRPPGELTVSAIWSYDSLVVYYVDASGQTVKGTPADLARHAATLLALAEQEGTT